MHECAEIFKRVAASPILPSTGQGFDRSKHWTLLGVRKTLADAPKCDLETSKCSPEVQWQM